MTGKVNLRSPDHRPWHPAPYNVDDIYALQAIARGTANDVQQKRALNWILTSLCRIYDPTFFPDSDRETVFAEAKRHVGLEIVKLINLPPQAVQHLRAKERKPKGETS